MIKTVELEKAEERYKLYFSQSAYDKMRLYVDLCEDEIGWLGYVDKLPNDGGYMVVDVFLLDQEVHGATTEISPTAILDFYNNQDEAGKEDFLKRCKIWGHSHVNMSTGPSGQDDSMAEALSKDVEDFYIRLITNKQGEYNITFYDKQIRAKVITDTILVYNPDKIELRKQIQEEIKEKVKKKTYYSETSRTGYSYWNRFRQEEKSLPAPAVQRASKQEVSKVHIDDIFDKSDYEMDFLAGLSC